MKNSRFHIENNQLIKTSNGQPVPDDEPTFILRGRDHLAIATLRRYTVLAIEDDCNNEFIDSICKVIQEFEKFSEQASDKMKQPGITRGK